MPAAKQKRPIDIGANIEETVEKHDSSADSELTQKNGLARGLDKVFCVPLRPKPAGFFTSAFGSRPACVPTRGPHRASIPSGGQRYAGR